jgi:hypothetical protein
LLRSGTSSDVCGFLKTIDRTWRCVDGAWRNIHGAVRCIDGIIRSINGALRNVNKTDQQSFLKHWHSS